MFILGRDNLDSALLLSFVRSNSLQWGVDDSSWVKVKKSRQQLLKLINNSTPIYGVSTGFGYLSTVRISPDKQVQLQFNLIRSHACGVGEALPKDKVRALMIIKAHQLFKAYSAVSESCLKTVLDFLKHDIMPVIPLKGSVGASGDLAPMAHMALGLIGEGMVCFDGKCVSAQSALKHCNIKPLTPECKDGLSLVNGTQFMAMLSAYGIESSRNLCHYADIAAALSLIAFRGNISAFDTRIHKVRLQQGQQEVAQSIQNLITNSGKITVTKNDNRQQDPYSFRCIPQVHGPARDITKFAASIVDKELNSVTDNPLIFENGDVVNGGNFHGQYLSLAMDSLALGIAELGNISQCRVEQLISPSSSQQPAFLIKQSGLNCGLMIPQVVAASLVAENRIFCTPASIDNIPTSAGKEDHVSMGPLACTKLLEICNNNARILAIELIAACQGIDLIEHVKLSPKLAKVYNCIRKISPKIDNDRSLSNDINSVFELIIAKKL